MRLSDEWITALGESENGSMAILSIRDEVDEFAQSGKFKERIEISWPYKGDEQGMPIDRDAMLMESVQDALQKEMEKNKLAILTGIYTGDNERLFVFYTRNIPAFNQTLNSALAPFEFLPIKLYSELDPQWEAYYDVRKDSSNE